MLESSIWKYLHCNVFINPINLYKKIKQNKQNVSKQTLRTPYLHTVLKPLFFETVSGFPRFSEQRASFPLLQEQRTTNLPSPAAFITFHLLRAGRAKEVLMTKMRVSAQLSHIWRIRRSSPPSSAMATRLPVPSSLLPSLASTVPSELWLIASCNALDPHG